MRKAFRHTGVLMMLGVVALGLVGAAYTLWYERLDVNITANTGDFDAGVSFASYNPETHTWGDEQTSDGATGHGRPVVGVFTTPISDSRSAAHEVSVHGYDFFSDFPVVDGRQKPPTTCDVNIGHTTGGIAVDANDGGGTTNQLNIVMGGLYPYAGCEYTIDFHNSGSVPMHLFSGETTYQRCTTQATESTPPSGCTDIPGTSAALSLAADPSQTDALQCGEILGSGLVYSSGSAQNIEIPGFQLHEGESLTCKFKILMDEDAIGENVTYVMDFHFIAHQWNEVPNPGQYPGPQFRDGVHSPASP